MHETQSDTTYTASASGVVSELAILVTDKRLISDIKVVVENGKMRPLNLFTWLLMNNIYSHVHNKKEYEHKDYRGRPIGWYGIARDGTPYFQPALEM